MTEAAYAGTSGAGLSSDIPATADNDAAVAALGGDCRMPTLAELQELRNNCDWTRKEVNGVFGYEVRSKASGNSNSIFLPAAGCINDGSLDDVGEDGYYWSSSFNGEDEGYAYYLYFDSEDAYPDNSNSDRYFGYSVRAVK